MSLLEEILKAAGNVNSTGWHDAIYNNSPPWNAGPAHNNTSSDGIVQLYKCPDGVWRRKERFSTMIAIQKPKKRKRK